MLKNYTIEKTLGKGTYGIVYKATQKDDNKICVIKQISLQGLNQSQKKEVKLESDILKSINSKYVVKYYDSFEEENNLNIVMEYCESGDLNDFIESQKKTKHLLPEKTIWQFFIKITLGLADIHKSKILHRDLKSLNIFLKEGNDVRVGDLGVAKVLNQTFFAKTFIGTPYYLSPEICEDKPYNDKSDVWALGCILYELCTYKHPFTAKSQGGLILKILNENPEPINNYYSKELKEVLNKIFDKDYKNRPSCLDILRMNFVIEKAKSLGVFEDIKKSFPDIEKQNNKNNQKVSSNKSGIKHIIINNNKGNKNSNNNNKKRPQSGLGFLAKGGKRDIKFNIGVGGKKKTPNLGGLNIPIKKKKGIVLSKIKIVPSKDHNNNNKNKAQKKDEISQKEKDNNFIFEVAEKFKMKCDNNKINNNNNNLKEISNNNPTIFNIHENQNNLINTKDLNNAYKVDNTLMTKNIDNIKDNNIKDNNNKDIEKETIKNPSLNYSIDTVYNKEKDENGDIKNTDINNINLDQTNKNDNNNCSVESDIYMTAKRDYYQPKNDNKEEKSKMAENPEEKIIIKSSNNPNAEDSLPLMKTNEFNELISDYASQKDTTINTNFKIIDNVEDKKEGNVDANKSVDSGEEKEKDENKYFSDNEDNGEETITATKIGEDSENEEEIKEAKKENLTKDLQEIKAKIEILKSNILKLLGEEKYKYANELMSNGIEDDTKQEEVYEKVEKFIKENCSDNNEEKMYDILSLYFLECQYKKKKEQLNKLN